MTFLQWQVMQERLLLQSYGRVYPTMFHKSKAQMIIKQSKWHIRLKKNLRKVPNTRLEQRR